MNVNQIVPIFLIVLLMGIFIKAKVVRIICGIILLALILSILSYVSMLPSNFNVIELIKEWLGLGKAESIHGGLITYVS